MIYAINMLGTILNASDGLIIAGMVFYILRKPGVAYRPWLWAAFLYPFAQGVTASLVFLNIYSSRFPLLMALCRLTLGLFGNVLAVIVAIYLRDFLNFLREQHDTKTRLVDERSNTMFAAEMIVESGRRANELQDKHLAILVEQGARLARHA